MGRENFRGAGGDLLLTGNALHGDIPPDAAGSAVFGWLLTMLGQDVGYPVPEGGAGKLSGALASRFTSAGGQIRTGARVTSVVIAHGRAVGVRCADGTAVRARRGILADVSAPSLYRDLVGLERLPPVFAGRLDRFQWDHATLKINWALDRPVPWTAAGGHGAGTVHLGVDADGFSRFAADLAAGRLPENPFMLFGQMTTSDPTRSPAGTESVWALHPRAQRRRLARRPTGRARRPRATEHRTARAGLRGQHRGSARADPADLQAANANLMGGATNGGTARIHQQLFFRPTAGTGRAEHPSLGCFWPAHRPIRQ